MKERLLVRKGISLDRLHTLRLVHEAGGISAAAGGEVSKQSLYSRQLRELEAVLGFPLLDRSSVPHTLTEEAERVARLTGGFELRLRNLAVPKSRNNLLVRVGGHPDVLRSLVIPALDGQLSSKSMAVELKRIDQGKALTELRAEKIDLALITGKDSTDGLESSEVLSFGWRVLASSKLMKAGRKALGWGELSSCPLVMTLDRNWKSLAVRECLEKYPDGPFIAVECATTDDALQIARYGIGVAVVPSFMSGLAKREGLVMRRVAEFGEDEYQLRVVHREGEGNRFGKLAKVLNGA